MANATGNLEYQDTHTATVRGTSISNTTFIIARDVTNKNSLTSAGNRYGIVGTDVEVVLDPDTTNAEEFGDRLLSKPIMVPKYGPNQDVKLSTRQYIDLKVLDFSITLTVNLTNESGNITGTSPAVSNTALGKKKVLMAMQEQGGPVRLYYRNEAFMGFIKRMQWTDVETEQIATTAGPSVVLKGIINFIVGTDKSVV